MWFVSPPPPHTHTHLPVLGCQVGSSAVSFLSYEGVGVVQHSPKKSLHLVLDGPGPAAKLPKQQERRVRHLASSAAVTPGTDFMADVEAAVQYWGCTYLARNQQKFVPGFSRPAPKCPSHPKSFSSFQ